MEIIDRDGWGAAPPEYVNTIDMPTEECWLHHSAGALDANGNGVWWDDVRGIQDFHMRPKSEGGRGWSDIAYSFLIGGGQVFEGRGFGVAGGHTKGRNTVSHGICIIGNYEIMEPTDHDLDALVWLLAYGRTVGAWGDLTGPHRDAPGAETACCGRHLIDRIPDIRRRVNQEAPSVDKEILMANITVDYDAVERMCDNQYKAKGQEMDKGGRAYWPPLVAFGDDPLGALSALRSNLDMGSIP